VQVLSSPEPSTLLNTIKYFLPIGLNNDLSRDFDGGGLTYQSPNIHTVKLYFHTPDPVLPCRCGQNRYRCVSMCADACRCVSMRADVVDAVISHTRL